MGERRTRLLGPMLFLLAVAGLWSLAPTLPEPQPCTVTDRAEITAMAIELAVERERELFECWEDRDRAMEHCE